MNLIGMTICIMIVAAALFSVYLLLRQAAYVAAHRQEVPIDFASQVRLDEHQRAADYTIARAHFGIIETLISAILSIGWLAIFLFPLYAFISQIIDPGLSRSVVFVVSFFLLTHFLELPLSLYNTFSLEEKFGFNRQNLPTFAIDEVKTAAISLLIGVPALYGMFFLFKTFPQTWWLVSYVVFMIFIVSMSVVYPTFIAPLFNTFRPLEDGMIKNRVVGLLNKCGFQSGGVFIMDASKRSTHGNAYFTGFGKSKRIVFFDTLFEKHSIDEIESILAHELGHFKHGHVFQMILQSAIVVFIGFLSLYWFFSTDILTSWFGIPHDPGVIFIALLLVKEPISLFLTPLLSWRSRRAEYEADDFARQMLGCDAMISALTRLTRDNLASLTPDPFYAAFYFSHPPVLQRVRQLRLSQAAI